MKSVSNSVALVLCGAAALWYAIGRISGHDENVLIFLINTFASLIALLCLLSSVGAIMRGASSWLRIMLICAAAMAVPVIQSTIRLYTPPSSTRSPNDAVEPPFTLLSANLLGPRNVSDRFFDEVRRLQPDVIALQELNPYVATKLSELLGSAYPCRVVQAEEGTAGMGVFARFQCAETVLDLKGAWIGPPQLVTIMLGESHPVLLANFHSLPPHIPSLPTHESGIFHALNETVRVREESMRLLLDAVAKEPHQHAILAGDLNATIRNRVYAMIRGRGLGDVGALHNPFGGGTWPASGFPLISWLLRIDYVFHAATLRPTLLKPLPESFGSDHRGIFVRFGGER